MKYCRRYASVCTNMFSYACVCVICHRSFRTEQNNTARTLRIHWKWPKWKFLLNKLPHSMRLKQFAICAKKKQIAGPKRLWVYKAEVAHGNENGIAKRSPRNPKRNTNWALTYAYGRYFPIRQNCHEEFLNFPCFD